MICKNCGSVIPDNAEECPYCLIDIDQAQRDQVRVTHERLVKAAQKEESDAHQKVEVLRRIAFKAQAEAARRADAARKAELKAARKAEIARRAKEKANRKAEAARKAAQEAEKKLDAVRQAEAGAVRKTHAVQRAEEARSRAAMPAGMSPVNNSTAAPPQYDQMPGASMFAEMHQD